MPHLRLLPLLAAVLLLLASASDARAGQYHLGYDFASDLSGWSGYAEPGYVLCGRGATVGCPDISTNRIHAAPGTNQAIWSQARWEWTAPPGTTIIGGALAYRTRMLHPQFFARVKMRADGVDWGIAPTLLAEQQTTALTDHVVALAGGFRQIGISLYAHPAVAGLVTDGWNDYITLVRLDVMLDDPIPPALAWVSGGGLLDGAWHRGDVCATIAISDAQSGVSSVWLASDGVTSLWASPGTGRQYQPGYGGAQPDLCLSAAALGDGAHSGVVAGADASGGLASPLPFTVHIDRTPPVGRLVTPAAVATDAQPSVALEVSDGMSGVLWVAAQIDGNALPLDFSAGRASGRPAAALASGAHTLTWSIGDGAGNRTDGSAQFSVPDTTPPALGSPQPPNGASLGDGDVLAVAVAVSDEGSGVDAASVDLTLDGGPLDHVWEAGGVVHAVVGVRLAAGAHHLVLRVADHAGNTARLAWDITIVATPGAPAGSTPASGGASAGAGAAPGAPGQRARARRGVRAVVARIGPARPRTVIVRLRARPRLRIVLRLKCGAAVRTLHVRANARGIARVRVVCAGAATVRLLIAPAKPLVRIAARRLPLRLRVVPLRRASPTVARVSGQLAELRGRDLVLEALTAVGWRRVGLVRADSAGRFSTSFAIVHKGQFALRARVPALAGAASAPFVLTMR